jgi:ribosomal protein S24E
MIFLNIFKKLIFNNSLKKLPQKKIKTLIKMYQVDKNRIFFIRSKLKYGKVLFQLEYQYYKNKYLINTFYKPVLINQEPDTSEKYSVDKIADYISIKKDI